MLHPTPGGIERLGKAEDRENVTSRARLWNGKPRIFIGVALKFKVAGFASARGEVRARVGEVGRARGTEAQKGTKREGGLS
jgi:hypothetical protein